MDTEKASPEREPTLLERVNKIAALLGDVSDSCETLRRRISYLESRVDRILGEEPKVVEEMPLGVRRDRY